MSTSLADEGFGGASALNLLALAALLGSPLCVQSME
jgi:hypothetical protein